jgi:hypothetical protein
MDNAAITAALGEYIRDEYATIEKFSFGEIKPNDGLFHFMYDGKRMWAAPMETGTLSLTIAGLRKITPVERAKTMIIMDQLNGTLYGKLHLKDDEVWAVCELYFKSPGEAAANFLKLMLSLSKLADEFRAAMNN